MRLVRLFVAVWPPDQVVTALRSLPRPETPGVRWSTEDQWHVTLRFLGNVDDVDAVRDVLSTVSMPAAQVEVGPATTRLGGSVLMLPVRGLDDLAHALPLDLDRLCGASGGAATRSAAQSGRSFTGHLTVARARARRTIPGALVGLPFEASWTATSFALVRSQTKPSGAVYTDVATFPLR